MSRHGTFDPGALLGVLEDTGVTYILIGGVAATLYGSPHVTFDVDIVPEARRENLEALASALEKLEARIRVSGVPDGLKFEFSADFLERVEILNLMTRYGDLDLTFRPSGTRGFEDLVQGATEVEIDRVKVRVAALADIIRSKEAADREKDRVTLPTLRRLLRLQERGNGA